MIRSGFSIKKLFCNTLDGLLSTYDVWNKIVNDNGVPRLSRAREEFLPLKQQNIPFLVECFRYWKNYNEYMMLKGENIETGEKLYLAVKCSKRGNDVFARRLEDKLGFFSQFNNEKFFSPHDLLTNKTIKTRLLWVTLTYDRKRCSLHDAWSNVMKEYNKWITRLRQKYGKIHVLWFNQSFPDPNGSAYGYPHLHCILLFEESSFHVLKTVGSDGVTRLRIKEKHELEAVGGWHSFIDVQALDSLKTAINYCKKYAQEACYGDSPKALLTSAILWLYRKQTYGLSSGFKQALSDLIRTMQISKSRYGDSQLALDGSKAYNVWQWTFCGLASARQLGITSDVWVKELTLDEFDKILNLHSCVEVETMSNKGKSWKR